MGFDPFTAGLAIVSSGISLFGASKQKSAEKAATRANIESVEEQTELEIEELFRQQEFLIEKAQEDKSDRVREADALFASMIVAMADGGGAGSINQVRFGVEIGFNEGIDIARIESNRRREIEARQSGKQAALNRLKDAKRAGGIRNKASSARFLGSIASTGLGLVSAFAPSD